MARRRLRTDRKGQFLVLTSVGIVIVMVTLSYILAYTAVSPLHFPKINFREATTQLSINFHQTLAIALADVSKELDLKASVSQYLKYTKLDEYPQAKDKGYESLTEWHKITLLRQSGLGLNLTVSKPNFQCNWGSSQGYSRAEANMTLDILSYGFYGWKSKVAVELSLTILSLKDIDKNVTSFSFSLKREEGVPVSGLAASSVKVFFQGKRNMFNATDPASIKLAYFGAGNYLLTCATRNMTYPIVKMILQDPNGIVVGAYSVLMKGDDKAGPKVTTIKVSKTHIPPGGTKVITLNATIDDTYPGGGWSNIIAAEYFIDDPGANGTGTPMVPVDGAFDSPKEDVWAQIDVTGWALGNYIIYVHGKDAKGNWGNFTSISLKVVETLKMHVARIDVYWEWSGGRRYVRAAVTIVDSDGNPVEGATVYGHWSGKITGNDSGKTDKNGRWISARQRASYSGTYTFTVDNVVLTDWIYDYGANVETSDSITG